MHLESNGYLRSVVHQRYEHEKFKNFDGMGTLILKIIAHTRHSRESLLSWPDH